MFVILHGNTCPKITIIFQIQNVNNNSLTIFNTTIYYIPNTYFTFFNYKLLHIYYQISWISLNVWLFNTFGGFKKYFYLCIVKVTVDLIKVVFLLWGFPIQYIESLSRCRNQHLGVLLFFSYEIHQCDDRNSS